MTPKKYRQEIGKILYMMAEVFRDTPSDSLLDGWVAVLASEKVTVEEAQAAAVQVMKSREYNKLPPPAAFLEIVRPQVKPEELAEAQADKVIQAVRNLGPYGSPEFNDPITAQLMSKRWPWGSFAANLETDKVKWWRKEFVEAYCWTEKAGPHALPTAKPLALVESKTEQEEEVAG